MLDIFYIRVLGQMPVYIFKRPSESGEIRFFKSCFHSIVEHKLNCGGVYFQFFIGIHNLIDYFVFPVGFRVIKRHRGIVKVVTAEAKFRFVSGNFEEIYILVFTDFGRFKFSREFIFLVLVEVGEANLFSCIQIRISAIMEDYRLGKNSARKLIVNYICIGFGSDRFCCAVCNFFS